MVPSPETAAKMRAVCDYIDSVPERFDMSCWLGHKAGCGTVGCFAGWAVLLDRNLQDLVPTLPLGVLYEHVHGKDREEIRDQAERLFGISKDDGAKLFGLASWPTQLHARYRTASAKERPAILRARVEHYIAIGE